jgi:hypothetical protein
VSATWPEDPLEPSFGELFDEALRPKGRSYVLHIPTGVSEQGGEVVDAWVTANHPGYPVVIAPEPLTLEEWVRRWPPSREQPS